MNDKDILKNATKLLQSGCGGTTGFRTISNATTSATFVCQNDKPSFCIISSLEGMKYKKPKKNAAKKLLAKNVGDVDILQISKLWTLLQCNIGSKLNGTCYCGQLVGHMHTSRCKIFWTSKRIPPQYVMCQCTYIYTEERYEQHLLACRSKKIFKTKINDIKMNKKIIGDKLKKYRQIMFGQEVLPFGLNEQTLKHKPEHPNENRLNLLRKASGPLDTDGLNSLVYKEIERRTHFSTDLAGRIGGAAAAGIQRSKTKK